MVPRLFFSLAIALMLVVGALPAQADEASDALQLQIDSLRNEIEQLQIQLNNTSAQKDTLQTAVKELDLQIQKLTKSISLTNAQISQKDKEIKNLSGSITTTSGEIGSSQQGVAEALREMQAQDDKPLMEALLGTGTLSGFFDEAASLGSLRDKLQNRIEDLSSLKNNLQSSKDTATGKRKELASLQSNLASQKQGLSVARTAQNNLLTETKNKESSYQALIAQKKAEESAFEAELIRLAAGLGSADTTSAPGAARGILGWPLDSVRITQYFGNTAFAQSGAYSGNGHNGIDFRASVGTPVKAALSGTVQEINQGAIRNCQYGKWVLIKHDNGLSTLYAHLSSIAAAKGQRVGRGQLIGYAGDTGYATGPHLHFTVYISSAVSFRQYTCNSGSSAFIPIAPLNAYVNPLSYLPGL